MDGRIRIFAALTVAAAAANPVLLWGAERRGGGVFQRLPALAELSIRRCAAEDPVADDAMPNAGSGAGNQSASAPDSDREPLVFGPDDPFSGEEELSLEQLISAVEARNPSLQAMIAAWQAASQRYWQVVSLDDPMFGFMMSTDRVGQNEGEAGYMLELSQQIPWPGKRHLRGHVADAQADAARGEVGVTSLQLTQMARTAFYQYYVARRQLQVNQQTSKLMEEFRDIARSKYEVNQAMQQDVLQAEVELADLAGRRSELARDEKIAMARINTLLLRAADYPLPPPPATIEVLDSVPSAELLQQLAMQSRPELYSIAAQIREEEANVSLAYKEYFPDMQFIARYDATMEHEAMRPMVGMSVNLPIWQRKRAAAVQEACARIQQRRAEYDNRLAEISFEVQSAVERLTQGREIVELYTNRILPATDASLRAAQANYAAGNIDFLRLLDAERQYNNQQERYHQSVGEYQTRLADLERAIGGLVPSGE